MNISGTHDCYGCGVCALVCSKKIIEIRLNDNGFYEPYITNSHLCSDCGLCVEVCSFFHDDLSANSSIIMSYAAWSKDNVVRRKCSSGGVGFEVGRSLIDQGYQVLGCRYNVVENRAEHYVASTVEELIPSIGSKYIQSYTVDGLKQIDRKKKYLITGTPCQIDSFRRYIKKFRCEDNFVLMDFFCHGVPSMLLWNKYVLWAERQVGKLTYVSWRNKFTGWHDSWAMAIDGEKHGGPVNWHDSYNMLISEKKSHLNSKRSNGDYFYHFFLNDSCLGRACYKNCKFKGIQTSADIRIGDLWGNLYQNNEEGISAVVAVTQRGQDILGKCNCEFTSHPFEVVAEGQLKQSPQFNYLRFCALCLLKSPMPLKTCYWLFNILKRINQKTSRL